jgi:phosphoribosylglycinamide formyltransferase-1
MYGMFVHNAVINNKEKESGITVHFVNEEYDKGEIILQAKCEITNVDTAETLSKKIQLLEFEYLPMAIESLL